jgi:hypothetical protein
MLEPQLVLEHLYKLPRQFELLVGEEASGSEARSPFGMRHVQESVLATLPRYKSASDVRDALVNSLLATKRRPEQLVATWLQLHFETDCGELYKT